MLGWLGQVLRVNLSGGTAKAEPLAPSVARTCLGGRGLATYLHASEVSPSAQPLGIENNLVLATGPLIGTLAKTSGSFD